METPADSGLGSRSEPRLTLAGKGVGFLHFAGNLSLLLGPGPCSPDLLEERKGQNGFFGCEAC